MQQESESSFLLACHFLFMGTQNDLASWTENSSNISLMIALLLLFKPVSATYR